MRRLLTLVVSILLSIAMAGCSSSTSGSADINLVFVVTQDLAHNDGDIDTSTANLNNQGLQRVIALASYLPTTLLGGRT